MTCSKLGGYNAIDYPMFFFREVFNSNVSKKYAVGVIVHLCALLQSWLKIHQG